MNQVSFYYYIPFTLKFYYLKATVPVSIILALQMKKTFLTCKYPAKNVKIIWVECNAKLQKFCYHRISCLAWNLKKLNWNGHRQQRQQQQQRQQRRRRWRRTHLPMMIFVGLVAPVKNHRLRHRKPTFFVFSLFSEGCFGRLFGFVPVAVAAAAAVAFQVDSSPTIFSLFLSFNLNLNFFLFFFSSNARIWTREALKSSNMRSKSNSTSTQQR